MTSVPLEIVPERPDHTSSVSGHIVVVSQKERFMKRIFLFLVTNLAVLALLMTGTAFAQDRHDRQLMIRELVVSMLAEQGKVRIALVELTHVVPTEESLMRPPLIPVSTRLHAGEASAS